jgi:hypothetical protein
MTLSGWRAGDKAVLAGTGAGSIFISLANNLQFQIILALRPDLCLKAERGDIISDEAGT